jgi:hypothetical protein
MFWMYVGIYECMYVNMYVCITDVVIESLNVSIMCECMYQQSERSSESFVCQALKVTEPPLLPPPHLRRMYVCMYVCVYVCMYVLMWVTEKKITNFITFMYLCMYVCMHVCVYVCLCVCMYCVRTHVTGFRVNIYVRMYVCKDGYQARCGRDDTCLVRRRECLSLASELCAPSYLWTEINDPFMSYIHTYIHI